ncbi:hypothetical protein D3C85_1373700 [compost metagenome]
MSIGKLNVTRPFISYNVFEFKRYLVPPPFVSSVARTVAKLSVDRMRLKFILGFTPLLTINHDVEPEE